MTLPPPSVSITSWRALSNMTADDAFDVKISSLQEGDRGIDMGAPATTYLARIRIVAACTEPVKPTQRVFDDEPVAGIVGGETKYGSRQILR